MLLVNLVALFLSWLAMLAMVVYSLHLPWPLLAGLHHVLLLLLSHEHGGGLLLFGGHLPPDIGSYHSTLGSLSVDISSSLGRVS